MSGARGAIYWETTDLMPVVDENDKRQIRRRAELRLHMKLGLRTYQTPMMPVVVVVGVCEAYARDPALRPIVRERQFARAKLEAQIVVWIVSKTTNKISRDS